MKRLINLFMLLSTSCAAGPNLNGFIQYEPYRRDIWQQRLESYYHRALPTLNQAVFYHGPLNRVRAECHSTKAWACINTDLDILIGDLYQDECLLGLHELMHAALLEIHGDGDHDHIRPDWQDVSDLCNPLDTSISF